LIISLNNKPKFINRWAGTFVSIYNRNGKEKAIEWALGFLDKEAVKPVADRAKQLLQKRY